MIKLGIREGAERKDVQSSGFEGFVIIVLILGFLSGLIYLKATGKI